MTLPLETDKRTIESTDISLMDVLKEMRDFRTEIRNTNKEFANQLELYSQWLIEHGGKIDELGNKLTVINADIERINQENVNLKKTVSELTVKLNIVEQSLKDKDLEISGVPYRDKENLMQLLGKISEAIGFDFNESMVDNVFRFKATGTRMGNIMVKFVRKLDKDVLIQKRRDKRTLNSRDIGFLDGEATVVYFNDSLTFEKRKLLNAARVTKGEKQYTYLWVRNGRIHMRKNQGDRFVIVNSVDDLAKLP